MPSPPVDLSRLLRFAGQRRGEQSEGKGTNKPNGPELHNSLLYGYEGTNITGEKAVKDAKTLLIDALNESYGDSRFCQFTSGLEPLWAWLYSVLDPQDLIKELMHCVLRFL